MQEEVEQINVLSDSELALKTIEDKKYFTFIIDRYSDKLSRYIRRISFLNQQDLEDLLQNVFIKIYVNLNDFDTSLSFNAWSYRITRNEVIDFLRKNRRKRDRGQVDTDDELLNVQDSGIDILEGLHIKENKEFVVNILKKMKPKHREILYLRFTEQYSYKDISDILRKTESNVTSIIHRAKKEFKKYYEQEYK